MTCSLDDSSTPVQPLRAASASPAPDLAASWRARRDVRVGDVLVVERRYVVDGALTSVEDTGRFRGVQLVGSTEHLVLEPADAAEGSSVRMIPLNSISEISVSVVPSSAVDGPAGFDPSVA